MSSCEMGWDSLGTKTATFVKYCYQYENDRPIPSPIRIRIERRSSIQNNRWSFWCKNSPHWWERWCWSSPFARKIPGAARRWTLWVNWRDGIKNFTSYSFGHHPSIWRAQSSAVASSWKEAVFNLITYFAESSFLMMILLATKLTSRGALTEQ